MASFPTFEPRLKYLLVPAEWIARVIHWRRSNFFRLPILSDIPNDVRVVSVEAEPEMRGFRVLLWSAEWEPLCEGATLPRINLADFPQATLLQDQHSINLYHVCSPGEA